MAVWEVSLEKPPVLQPNLTYCCRILYSFSSLQRRFGLFWPLLLTCGFLSACSPHTHIRTCPCTRTHALTNTHPSNRCRDLLSLSVCLSLPYLSSHGERSPFWPSLLLLNQPPRFVPIWCRLPRYQSNYPVLAIYIPPSHCMPAACHWDTTV